MTASQESIELAQVVIAIVRLTTSASVGITGICIAFAQLLEEADDATRRIAIQLIQDELNRRLRQS